MKILCSKEDFFSLYDRCFKDKSPKKQVNYYFDKDFSLIDKATVLRIREKEGKYVVTVKEKKSNEKNLSIEKTEKLEKEDFLKIMEVGEIKVEDYIKGTITGTYNLLGSLETIRDEKEVENVLLVFDQSSYFSKKDYEIEMEGKQRDLINFYNSIDIKKDTNSGKTKISRFLDEYKRKYK